MAEDLGSLIAPTAVLVGLISIAIYVFIIRPTLPSNRRDTAVAGATATHNGTGNGTARNAAAAAAHTTTPKEQIRCSRVPPHVSDSSAMIAVNGGSNLLIDGLVAFKHSRASTASSTDDDIRKSRAKLFSNLLEGSMAAASGISAPPAKGSAIVVTIPLDSVSCAHQRRVLYLLATYYNLLVILAVPTEQGAKFREQDRKDSIALLRGEGDSDALSTDTLPTHRIVVSSTVTGRVAFVRQLQRIELVLDYDSEVLALLTRFGHRVIVYGSGESDVSGVDNESISELGKAML